jgi:hypothetical protein
LVIENLSSVIYSLAGECDHPSRILGKSMSTAKAVRKPGLDEDSDKPLPMTNDRFSVTNFQSRSPKSERIPSPKGLNQKSEMHSPLPPRDFWP